MSSAALKIPRAPIVIEEKTITISENEYNSLKATAELFRHMDVYEFTLESLQSGDRVSLEEAFEK